MLCDPNPIHHNRAHLILPPFTQLPFTPWACFGGPVSNCHVIFLIAMLISLSYYHMSWSQFFPVFLGAVNRSLVPILR